MAARPGGGRSVNRESPLQGPRATLTLLSVVAWAGSSCGDSKGLQGLPLVPPSFTHSLEHTAVVGVGSGASLLARSSSPSRLIPAVWPRENHSPLSVSVSPSSRWGY